MYCRKCGHEIPDDSVFCVNCGAPVEVSAAPSSDSTPSAAENQVSDVSSSRANNKSPWKWILVSFTVVALIICGVLFFSSRGKDVSILKDREKLQSVSSSVLLIECYDVDGELYATGSGFIAFDSRTIVTNYHVIEDYPYSIAARSEDGEVFEVDEIVGYHQELDIAFLRVKNDTGLAPLTFSSKTAEKTDPVVAIGSPFGLMNTVSEGIVSGFSQIGDESVIQFTASISHGSSGGVLLNEKGEVLGVTFGSFSNGQNLNLAVPIEYVEAFYSRLSPADSVSVFDFYIFGDHVFPVDFVLSHYDLFVGSPISIQGYISSLFYYHSPENPILFLTGSESAIILFDDLEWERNLLDWWEAVTTDTFDEYLVREDCNEWDEELARAEQKELVVVRFNISRSFSDLTPGDMVVVTGVLQESGHNYHSYKYIKRNSLVLETDSISIIR